MPKTKKDKKQARKERQQQLRAAADEVQERLLASTLEPTEAVEYVLDEEGQAALNRSLPHHQQQRLHGKDNGNEEELDGGGASNTKDGDSDDDDDRVELPGAQSAAAAALLRRRARKAAASSAGAGRKHRRLTWQALKLAVTERYGAAAAELVSEHDGNAEDPFFTVLMKAQPSTVPVPRHWDRLRAYMSLQADREEAVGIVPPEIQALGVDKIRAAKDKRANPDQIAFMSCFMTGTPLQRKTFGVELTRFGDVHNESRWLPKAHYTPGELSQRLRAALGMGATAPPPWLYSMQTMGRLPPAYPSLRAPGLNAPIPAGAQWGRGQGQWGDPPRAGNNNFLFPGVMDEAAASAANAVRLWGVVPPLRPSDGEAARGAKGHKHPHGVSSPPPRPRAAAAAPPPTAAAKVAITPTPFRPQEYQPQVPVTARHVSTTPREYTRMQDSGAGATVAVGHRMVLKGSTAGPPPPQQKHQQQQQQGGGGAKQPPERPATAKAPPPKSSRGTKF